MTRALLVVVLLLGGGWPALAAEIRDYQMTIRTNAAGEGEAALTVVFRDPVLTMRLPVGFATITDARVSEGPSGVSVVAERTGGQSLLVVQFPGAESGDVPVTIVFRTPSVAPVPVVAPDERPTLPTGNRLLKYSVINTEPAAIGHYIVRILIPPGLRVHAVREALPKLRGAEPGPRVLIGAVEAMRAVTLEVSGLKQGDATSVQAELTPQSRSWSWLVVGVMLSALYLWKFSDLIARPVVQVRP